MVTYTNAHPQLKEEIQQKDNALINAHFNYKTLQDEMKMNKRMLAKRRDVLHQTDNVLESQDSEIKNLRRTLKEAEVSQKQQKKLYDEMVQERDILGTQLIRRNDELALIYEKLRIQQVRGVVCLCECGYVCPSCFSYLYVCILLATHPQATLHRGEILYRERLEDISGETSELNNLKRILQIRSHEVTSIEALKNQVYLVQRELLQERTKVKV
jgi:small-conductance mechanosensitive channel